MSRLNPKVVEIEYGKRELKNLTLYPLSLSDQFKVTDIIGKVIQGLGSLSDEGLGELQVFTSFMEQISNNAVRVIEIVCDVKPKEAEAIFQSITNDQFVYFAEQIWEVNFEAALKNGKNLFGRIKKMTSKETPPKRSTQESLRVIPNIPSDISLNTVTETEDLLSDKPNASTSAV